MMDERRPVPIRIMDWMDRRWLGMTLAGWLVAAALVVWLQWARIYWFALSDTDDNMRVMQVRALLAGQDWYDLRQYRMDPPYGADIHWSRIVDLPLAGLRLVFDLFTDGPSAERAAAAIAPLLPLGVVMVGVALTTRRLLGPLAYLVAVPILFFAVPLLAQFMPTRVDHHGWQLAMLSLVVAGLADPVRGRGGVTAGLATAVSLAIGLEFLPYLGLAAGLVALTWVRDAGEARRLVAYGASLAGGTALGYAAFASYANRAPVCDALSPVWLSAAVAGGALLVLLPRLALSTWQHRLIAAGIAAVLLAAAFALAWPHCLGKPEGASEELQRLWLSNVREVKPIWRQSRDMAIATLALPIAGLAGSLLLAWTRRRESGFAPAAALALLSATSLALLLWQTRAAPGAQLLGITGVAALVWLLFPRLRTARSLAVRVAGPVLLVMLASGAVVPLVIRALPATDAAKKKTRDLVGIANRRCPALPAFRPLTGLAPGTVFTFVDLSPRLVTLTRHDAVAGPYHRNSAAIIDVMRAFRGTADEARARIIARNADYVLICPNMSESTLYSSGAPRGFYVQLRDGRVPDWLTPVVLPKSSPYKMWRVIR